MISLLISQHEVVFILQNSAYLLRVKQTIQHRWNSVNERSGLIKNSFRFGKAQGRKTSAHHFTAFSFFYGTLPLALRGPHMFTEQHPCVTHCDTYWEIFEMQSCLKAFFTLISGEKKCLCIYVRHLEVLPREPECLHKVQSQCWSSRKSFNFSTEKQIIKYMKAQGPLLTNLLFLETLHFQG